MDTIPLFLSRVIVLIHLAWTLLMFGGTFLMLFWQEYALYHIYILSFTLLISIPFRGTCPLTTLEETLRKKIDPLFSHHGSFITTYINRFLGTHHNPNTTNKLLGVFYIISYLIAITLLIYT